MNPKWLMVGTFWAALAGFALGSLQSLFLDWARARSQHRKHLRLWRSELRRLSGYRQRFDWSTTDGPSTDVIPNAPRITPSYLRLLQETDFWITDEHEDDNTQQGLIDIADGGAVLERYSADVAHLVGQMKAAPKEEKMKLGDRAIQTSRIYNRELDRWQIMISSALSDVERRLRSARPLRQIGRALRPMPKRQIPPALPPISYSLDAAAA